VLGKDFDGFLDLSCWSQPPSDRPSVQLSAENRCLHGWKATRTGWLTMAWSAPPWLAVASRRPQNAIWGLSYFRRRGRCPETAQRIP